MRDRFKAAVQNRSELLVPFSRLIPSLSDSTGIVDHNSNCYDKLEFKKDRQFHPLSQLVVSKFRAANTANGKLLLQVISDYNMAGLKKSGSKQDLPNLNLLKLSAFQEEKSPILSTGSIIGSGSFFTQAIERDADASDIPDRQSAGSPFPSPTVKKKVLNFANSRLNIPQSSSVSKNYSPTKLKSGLQFEFPTAIHHDVVHDHESNLSPDGTELYKQLEVSNAPRKLSIIGSELYGTFVGSYEESIIIGRMSQKPSKPIPFIIEIGVLATAKCRPTLKCPPHIQVPFSAYFYQLPGEDNSTPYVATIDLDSFIGLSFDNTNLLLDECSGYRIPHKGQLQIVNHRWRSNFRS